MVKTRKRYGVSLINLSKQAFIALALNALFTLTVLAQANARPNVVIILVDDMGWSDIG